MTTTKTRATNARVQAWTETAGALMLYVLDCGNCGVIFAIDTNYEQRRRDDGKDFYCPNGHACAWTKTEAMRLQEKLDREKELREWYAQQAASRDEDLRAEKVSHAVTKGKLTKARKRADAGVCQHCKKTFQDVARHVASQHAGVLEDA